MLSRRFSEFALKPFSALQALIRDPLFNYQRAPLGVPREDSKADSDHSHQNSQQEDDTNYNQQNNHNYNYRARSIPLSILPLFAIMTHKLNNVSCLFASKPEVFFINFPFKLTNPIEK